MKNKYCILQKLTFTFGSPLMIELLTASELFVSPTLTVDAFFQIKICLFCLKMSLMYAGMSAYCYYT